MTHIESRKQAHLDVCLHHDVEYGSTRLDEMHLIHTTFPELALSDISTSTKFLHHAVSAPLCISCMTGGSEHGAHINRRLAEAAHTLHIPLGLGSIRILFEQKERIADFQLKKIAPSVPILANLGAIQLRDISYGAIFSMLDLLEVDAIVLHVNPAQELYQTRGERDFTNILSHVKTFTTRCPIPVIVKEVGSGISPADVEILQGYGVHYIDVAGQGGSHWVKIEHLHNNYEQLGSHQSAQDAQDDLSIYELGIPTAMIMYLLRNTSGIIASGGIRSAMDVAKCLVLGAQSVGMALPVIRQAMHDTSMVIKHLQHIIQELTHIMLLCGVSTIKEMKQIPFWLAHDFQKDVEALGNALHISSSHK